MDHRKQQLKRIQNMLWIVMISILLSVALGGYWFVAILNQAGAHARKETLALLELEEAVNDTASSFARQTQEWKNQLLRSHDPALFAEHHQDIHIEAASMQKSLQRAKLLLQAQGLAIADIVSIEKHEQALLSEYAAALSRVDSNHPQFFHRVDEQVRGKDRAMQDELKKLQVHLSEAVREKFVVLGRDRMDQAISSPLMQLGLLAISLPLVALFAFLKAYRALRENGRSDARIRTIHESITDAVMVVDQLGRVDTLNATAQTLTGWSQKDAHNKPLSDVFRLSDAGAPLHAPSPAELVLKTGRPAPMSASMLLRRPDGSEVTIEASASPVFDENGLMSAVVMVFHDVSHRHATILALKDERALFRQTFDQAAVGIAQLSLNGRWSKINRKLCEITGYSEAELLELSFMGITHPEDLVQDIDALQNLLARHTEIYGTEKRYIRKDGSIIWVEVTVSIVWKEDGTPDYGISIIQDIQARKDADLAALRSRAQYKALFEQMPEGMLLFDEHLQVIAHNNEAMRQLEYDSEELLNLHVGEIEMMDNSAAIEQRKINILETGRDNFESRYRTGSGQIMDVNVSVKLVHLENGRPVFQTLFHDITKQKQAAQQIEHLAYHDQLTGLANRRLLQDRIDQALSSAARRNTTIAVCYLDLDHFKDVNDILGHQAGDQLLQVVSTRLLSCIRAEDTVARVGGDEFVIMLNDISDFKAAAAIAQKIVQKISIPFTIDNEEINVTPSIGISVYPQDAQDSEALLRHADSAMYQAKESGRATYRFYTDALHQKVMERLKIERRLRKAIEYNEFEMYYQPQINLQTNQITGCEALIRWNPPDMGQVPPAQFIPVAEHSNLIVEIGAWVIHQVCRQARAWQDHGLKLKVSFNVSARQFMRPDELLQTLRHALAESGVDPALMELELTESLLLDPQGMSEILNEISAMGLSIALDDFGTGYSSLSYLRRFPIHILKIDQSFVSDSDHNPNDAEMVKTIIGMAHNLRMNLVAEGVETAEQVLLLLAEGCQVAQGYYFSRPVPVKEFDALLRLRRSKAVFA